MMPHQRLDGLTPAEAAEAYAALGWAVVPITPGRKHPPLPQWQHAATDNLDTIRSWFGGLYRDHGVGIVTGPQSRFWVLDVDIANGKPGDDNLRDLCDRHGPLPATPEAVTGSGGSHLLFRWEPDRPIHNGMASNLPSGLDIRGAGGQIVAAPTTHPGTGRPYRWRPGLTPWDLPIAAAPDWLYQLLQHPTETGPTTPAADTIQPRQPADSAPGEGPADWLRHNWDWHHELENTGWAHHSHHPGQTWWTRPGKHPRDGHSAVLHEPDGPLVVFSTEVPAAVWGAGTATADGSGVSLTPFGFVAGYRFGGDTQAAGRALRSELRPGQTVDRSPVDIAPAPDNPGHPEAETGPWPGFGVWAPADLATYLDPDWRPEPPTVLKRNDGRGLWYRANVNWLHGASGEGKTWVALIAVAQELEAGRHVMWVHYEDPLPDKIVHRLVLLGVEPDVILDRFHVACVGGAPMRAGVPFIRSIAAHYDADLVVVDSIGEAIGSDGIAVKDDERFVEWLHSTARVIAGDGRTFLGIDHLPMGEPGRLDPVGSFRKKAATTGSMFLAESPRPPTQTEAGWIRLTCAKDRSGVWTKGVAAAIVHLRPSGGRLEWAVEAPQVPIDRAGEPETIILGRHAVRAIRKHGPQSQRGLLSAMSEVHGRTEAKRRGIDFAVLQGWLSEVAGPRNARHFEIGPNDPPTADDLLEQWEAQR